MSTILENLGNEVENRDSLISEQISTIKKDFAEFMIPADSKKLSVSLYSVASSLQMDASKPARYNLGQVFRSFGDKVYAMETAMPNENDELKERSIPNRIRSFIYRNFSDNISTENLIVDRNLDLFGTKDTHSASFMDKLHEQFSQPVVLMLTQEEKEAETKRILEIKEKIEKANNLPNVPIFIGTDEHIFETGTPAYANHKGIFISPLYTKYQNDNDLASEIGHELAHIHCCHVDYHRNSWTSLVFNSANETVDKTFNLKKDNARRDVLATALYTYNEYEADKIGGLFAFNAGFKPCISNFNLNKSKIFEEQFVRTEIYGYPTLCERKKYLNSFNYSQMKFSLEERLKEFDSMSTDLSDPQKALSVEEHFMKKIIAFNKMDNKIFEDRIQSITQSSDKIHALPHIVRYQYLEKMNLMQETSPTLRTVYQEQINKKQEHLKRLAEQTVKSVSELDKVTFYTQQVIKSNKVDLVMESTRSAYKEFNKGKANFEKYKNEKINQLIHNIRDFGHTVAPNYVMSSRQKREAKVWARLDKIHKQIEAQDNSR